MGKIKFSKKITLYLLGFVLFSFLFFAFIYLPQKRKINEMKENLAVFSEELREVAGGDSESEELIKFRDALHKKIVFLKARFPSSEEEVIKELSQLSASEGISIVSIKSSFYGLESKEEKKMFPPDENVRKIYMDIQAEGTYVVLGKFLEKMRKELPAFIIVDKLTVDRFYKADRLEIRIGLFFYSWDFNEY